MSSDDDSRRGICILSLDSGGPGTYSQLLILQEYMSRLSTDLGVSEEDLYPADYFDLIGGVGFGGLVAVMLGLLRMNMSQAIGALDALAATIFPEGSRQAIDKSENSDCLKSVIEGMLSARNISLDTKMFERDCPPSRCKVVLYAAASTDMSHPHLFRSYSHRGSGLNPTIVEAVCATISIPSHFSPVIIGPRRTAQSFVGGPLGVKNPTREMLKEANAAFGADKRVAQVISVGCEAPPVLSLEEMNDEVGVGRLLKEMALDCQMVAKDLSTRLYEAEAYLRLNIEKGVSGIEFDDWSRLGDLGTHTKIYIENAAVTRGIDASLRSLQKKVGTITLGQLNQSSSIKVAAKTVPSVSIHYVARAKPWGTMVQHLVVLPSLNQRIFVITGMGGCGKTQMVAYFFQEYPLLYNHVVFVDASSSSSIEADFQAWARNLGEGHERDIWEDGLRILSNISQDERWALIIDNADDPTLKLVSFIPKNINLTIIITSRNRHLGSLSTTYHLELGEMEEGEAIETLLHAARRDLTISTEEMNSARALVKELGYVALALAQAGTYCHQLSSQEHGILHPYTFTQYFSLFCERRAQLMKKPQPFPLDSYERGVYTTLDISYQRLSQDTRDFIHFISFFHHTNIPLAAFAAAARNGFEDGWYILPRPEAHTRVLSNLGGLLGTERTWNEFQVQELIAKLRSFSLVSATPIAGSLFLQMHPLIQAWSRDMVSSTPQRYKEMAMQVLTSCDGTKAFLLYRHITPHILDILGNLEVQDIHINDLMIICRVLRDQGHYRKATELVEVAVEKMKDSAEHSAGKTLVVTAQLANLYYDSGRWDEAERLEVEVLEQQKRVLGLEHPDTIDAAASLASTYSKQGRWSEAEKLELEVLERRTRLLGMEHPDTIDAAANLASTYSNQGRWSEAEKLRVEVLERWTRLLGMEHPDTIDAAANLASTYSKQGRWSEAEKLRVEVLERRTRLLGMEHPDSIRAAANLASTYSNQGRWSEAEKLQLEALERRTRLLGLEHPDTIDAAANLASTYSKQGRWSEAEKLQLEVLERWTRLLGLEHPDTIDAAANLAATYSKQGRWSEAEKLRVEVLERRTRLLGMEHPDSIRAAANLASTYSNQGRWSEAEKLQLESLERRTRLLGMEHPDSIRAAANLASTYSNQGRWSEAEKLQLEALERRTRLLGLEHPDTIDAAANLAATYSKQGRWSEAEKLRVEVLERRTRLMGVEHPSTIQAAADLAFTYLQQGRWSEAEKLQLEGLERCTRLLGTEHPDTITATASLASTYWDQGRHGDAEKLEVEVWERRKRLLGMEHPDTIAAATALASTYHAQGRGSEAEKIHVEVLEQQRRILGMEHPDTILAEATLAITYYTQGRFSEAAELLAVAVKRFVNVVGQQHPDTQAYASDLVEMYLELGKQQEAEETRALLLS